ncbi:hypothetical protein GHI93_11590 [Lactococcus hircilactis]|uniref:Prophage protein n=1 Tax=Lactococcus hircilactis TaxID=1494462 RepID=A0A7X1ZA50_9LACT|nr:DUF6711 family protein [Lactococcus hircilactis]MQW40563.1 hypothetical protein [Lactococcus hircilactis]
MSGSLSINGVIVKNPKTFKVGYQTIDADSSGRNANGEMVRDIITQKVKLEIEWGALDDSTASALLKAIKAVFFTVNYPDAETGTQQTKTFYSGDRSLPSYSWNDKFNQIKWGSFSTNFIEK